MLVENCCSRCVTVLDARDLLSIFNIIDVRYSLSSLYYILLVLLITLLGCPTENMKVFKTNPLLCFQVARSTIGKIETIPQMGMTLKMFVPNAILNQQC